MRSGSVSRSSRVAAGPTALVLEAEPQLALRPAGLAAPRAARCGARSRSKLAHLRLRLLDVAEVGHEAARVRPDDRQAAAAGEAGEVADVDQVGDEQQVELALGEPRGDAVGAAHSAALSRSSASR